MLELLHIENIAVIEETEIAFHPGFNVLTGETGAGKSIVIDAMGAVLGQRTPRDLIRTGAGKAFVSALFSGVPEDLTVLEESGVSAEGGELLLQREIYADGKNTCRANGRPITVALLRQIGSSLLNIHGQHDGQLLLDEERHCAYLDSFGATGEILQAYQTEYRTMAEIRKKIKSLAMDEAERERRVDTLRHQIDELERAELKEGEEETLAERRNILRNGEKFLSAVQGAAYCLNGSDESMGAVALLREAENALRAVRGMGEQFVELTSRLEAVESEVYDIGETVRDLRESYDFSPAELDAVESRSDQLYRLEKKYGPTVGDMLAYLDKCRQELDGIEYADDTIARLEKELRKQEKRTKESAKTLTEARKSAAEALERRIQEELRQLSMPKVRFAIQFGEMELGENGGDEVRFLMSANVGEDLKPINRIASGGELSRIMLAIRTLLAEQDHTETLIFDEIDTGISGRTAQKVSEKMALIAAHCQVICITHLPQIAAMADSHFEIRKTVEKGATHTGVYRLSEDGACEELARMLGGAEITDRVLENAVEMRKLARQFKNI